MGCVKIVDTIRACTFAALFAWTATVAAAPEVFKGADLYQDLSNGGPRKAVAEAYILGAMEAADWALILQAQGTKFCIPDSVRARPQQIVDVVRGWIAGRMQSAFWRDMGGAYMTVWALAENYPCPGSKPRPNIR